MEFHPDKGSVIRIPIVIEQTAAQGNNKIGFLKRNRNINNPDIKHHAYKTLIRATREYNSIVWDPHPAKAVLQLEMVQHCAARLVMND